MDREHGTVKFFNESKGYGFIARTQGGDCFVHISEIKTDGFRTLKEGQQVEFTARLSGKGMQAINVIPGAFKRGPAIKKRTNRRSGKGSSSKKTKRIPSLSRAIRRNRRITAEMMGDGEGDAATREESPKLESVAKKRKKELQPNREGFRYEKEKIKSDY